MADKKFENLVKKGDQMACRFCGNINFSVVAHLDGKEWFSTIYECKKCKGVAKVSEKREPSLHWEDGEIDEN